MGFEEVVDDFDRRKKSSYNLNRFCKNQIPPYRSCTPFAEIAQGLAKLHHVFASHLFRTLMKTILWCLIATIGFALLLHALIPEQVPLEETSQTATVLNSVPTDTPIKPTEETSSEPELPVFTEESIARYNGADPSLPIYIAFEGLVYDVSAGRRFYEPGGAYDFLAGTDGTTMLRIAGGDIIKKKYPVVGTFSE